MMSEKVKVQELALFLIVLNCKHRYQEQDMPWSNEQSSGLIKSTKPAVINLSTKLEKSCELFFNGCLHIWLGSVWQDPKNKKGDSPGSAVAFQSRLETPLNISYASKPTVMSTIL